MKWSGFIGALFLLFASGSVLAEGKIDNGWFGWLKSKWLQTEKSGSQGPSQKFKTALRMAKDGRCPSFKKLSQLKGVRKHKKGLGYSFTLLPYTKLYQGPSIDDKVIDGGEIEAMKKIRLYGAAGHRLLIATSDYNLCGWVNREAVLGTQYAQNSKWSRCFRGEQAFKGLLNGRRVFRRGPSQFTTSCVLEKPDGVEGSLKLRAIPQFDLSKSPNQKFILFNSLPAHDSISLKWEPQIYDIFSARILTKKQAGSRRAGPYFLLGSSTATGKKVRGWVHENNVRLWYSRRAVFWAGTGRGRATLKGKTFVKERSSRQRQGRSIIPRFPVIGDDQLSQNMRGKGKNVEAMFFARNLSVAVQFNSRIRGSNVLSHWVMIQDNEWEIVRKIFADACHLFQADRFNEKYFREFKDVLMDNAQRDSQCNDPGNCSRRVSFSYFELIPAWKAVEGDFDDYDDDTIDSVHKKLCKISYLLDRVDKNEAVGRGTVAKPYDLKKVRWNSKKRKWGARRRHIQTFDWKFRFPNGMLFYYIPVEFVS